MTQLQRIGLKVFIAWIGGMTVSLAISYSASVFASCTNVECIQTDCQWTDNCQQYDYTMAFCLKHNTATGDGMKTKNPMQGVMTRGATCTTNYCTNPTTTQVGNACSSNATWGAYGNQEICCYQGSDPACNKKCSTQGGPS